MHPRNRMRRTFEVVIMMFCGVGPPPKSQSMMNCLFYPVLFSSREPSKEAFQPKYVLEVVRSLQPSWQPDTMDKRHDGTDVPREPPDSDRKLDGISTFEEQLNLHNKRPSSGRCATNTFSFETHGGCQVTAASKLLGEASQTKVDMTRPSPTQTPGPRRTRADERADKVHGRSQGLQRPDSPIKTAKNPAGFFLAHLKGRQVIKINETVRIPLGKFPKDPKKNHSAENIVILRKK